MCLPTESLWHGALYASAVFPVFYILNITLSSSAGSFGKQTVARIVDRRAEPESNFNSAREFVLSNCQETWCSESFFYTGDTAIGRLISASNIVPWNHASDAGLAIYTRHEIKL